MMVVLVLVGMFLVPVPFLVPIVMHVRLLVTESAHVHVNIGVHVRLNVNKVLDIRVHWRIVAVNSATASVAPFFALLGFLVVMFRLFVFRFSVMMFGLVVVTVAWSWS